MITKLYAKGLKVLTFEENLEARTVFTGRVGAGKSARGQAVWLLAAGTVPGTTVGKKGNDILDALGDGSSIIVGGTIDGVEFERRIERTKAGTVTTNTYLQGKKVPKAQYDAAMQQAMQLCDVTAFLSASDTKQMEVILSLIPGDEAGRIVELNKQEDALKLQANDLHHKIKGAEASLSSMIQSRNSLEIPSATLPEIQAEIAKLTGEVSEVDQQIGAERNRIEAEEAAARAKAIEDAKPKPEPIPEPAPVETPMLDTLGAEPQPVTVEPIPTPKPATITPPAKPMAEGWHPQGFVKVADLEKVIKAMDAAGCSACAAKMLIKKLIRECK